jgi:hypothetical protein
MMATRPALSAIGIVLLAVNLCQAQPADGLSGSDRDIVNQELVPEASDAPPAAAADLWPYRPPPGWFAELEALLARPHIAVFSIFPDGIEPVPDLKRTVVPGLTLGYSLPRGNAFLVSYRYLGGEGTNQTPFPFDNPDPPWHSSVDSHWLDLDYRGALHGPACWLTFQWQTGVRLADIVYRRPGINNDTFLGAGPHFGIDLSAYVARTGVGLFGRGDVGLLLGGGQREADAVGAGVLGVLNGRGEVGLSWSLPTRRWVRVEGGYLAEGFTLSGHGFGFAGPFLRCAVGF